MPTATASTGALQREPRCFRYKSRRMISTPMAAPMAIITNGSVPPNMPSATDFTKLACGAGNALTPAWAGSPMP